jgi:hypothetical protein
MTNPHVWMPDSNKFTALSNLQQTEEYKTVTPISNSPDLNPLD